MRRGDEFGGPQVSFTLFFEVSECCGLSRRYDSQWPLASGDFGEQPVHRSTHFTGAAVQAHQDRNGAPVLRTEPPRQRVRRSCRNGCRRSAATDGACPVGVHIGHLTVSEQAGDQPQAVAPGIRRVDPAPGVDQQNEVGRTAAEAFHGLVGHGGGSGAGDEAAVDQPAADVVPGQGEEQGQRRGQQQYGAPPSHGDAPCRGEQAAGAVGRHPTWSRCPCVPPGVPPCVHAHASLTRSERHRLHRSRR